MLLTPKKTHFKVIKIEFSVFDAFFFSHAQKNMFPFMKVSEKSRHKNVKLVIAVLDENNKNIVSPNLFNRHDA